MFALAPPATAAQVTFLRPKKDEADTELIHPGPKTHTYTNTHPACNNTPFTCASHSLALPPQLWNGETATVHFPNKSQWFLQANGCGLLTWTWGAADGYPCWCHCLRFGICMSLTSQAYVKYTNSLRLQRADSTNYTVPVDDTSMSDSRQINIRCCFISQWIINRDTNKQTISLQQTCTHSQSTHSTHMK